MSLKLEGFKKIHDDDNSAVLQHPSGHKILVAKSALSKSMRSQIENIPHYDDGGEVESPDDPNPPTETKPDEFDDMVSTISSPFRGNTEQAQEHYESDNASLPKTPLPGQYDESTSQSISAPEPEANASSPRYPIPPIAQQSSSGIPDQSKLMGNYQKDVQGYLGGLQAEAKAKGDLGKAQAQVANQQVQFLQNTQKSYNESRNKLMNEYESFKKDYLDGHIDPNHYMSSMSGGQKVATAIGLILGGMGGGMTGGPNPALQFLNSQIDRDIDAQKAELGKKHSLLSANLQMFGNLNEATNMTRAMQAGIYSAQLEKAAAASQDPMAKAKAMQLSNYFKLNVADPMMNSIAQSQAIRSMMGQPGSASMQEYLPPDMRERAVNVDGKILLAPTKGDAEKSREALSTMSELKNQVDSMKSFMNNEGRVFNPYGEDAAKSKALRDNMILNIGKLHGLNRLSDTDLHMYQGMINDPGSWNQAPVRAQLEQFSHLIDSKKDSELSNRLEGYRKQPQAGPQPKLMRK